MLCELCGRKAELVDAIVEGSMLSVCQNCARFGNVIAIKKPETAIRPGKRIIVEEAEPVELIVPNYSVKIKEARELLKLKQEGLASRINEKESIIHKLESGSIKPTIELARKLERALNIHLIRVYTEPEKTRSINLSNNELTIGDLIRIRRRHE